MDLGRIVVGETGTKGRTVGQCEVLEGWANGWGGMRGSLGRFGGGGFPVDNERMQAKGELSMVCDSNELWVGLFLICSLLRYRAGRRLASCVFVVRKEHSNFGLTAQFSITCFNLL